jgi:hypothetical protein
MEYPDELDEEKTMKKWHEAIRSAPSLITSIFKDGKIKAMTKRELHKKLGEKGIIHDKYDVIREAERKKIISIDYKTWSAYFWIPPEEREREKAVEDAFLGEKELSEDELREILASRGLSTDEIERAIYEAERDCKISSFYEKKVKKYGLIPSKEREDEMRYRRLKTLYSSRWLYDKMLMESIFSEEMRRLGT